MKRSVRRVCVYCGSGSGQNPAYMHVAHTLGRCLAEADIGLVYGGGGLGLMGETARSVLDHGGHVTGIIPEFLTKRERSLSRVQDLIVTTSMHERKQLMFDYSDAFVALPGGVGTLEELVEQLTWSQLGQHSKPIVLVNTEGFWQPLLMLFDQMREEAFIRPGLELKLLKVDRPEEVVETILEKAREAERLAEESVIPLKF